MILSKPINDPLAVRSLRLVERKLEGIYSEESRFIIKSVKKLADKAQVSAQINNRKRMVRKALKVEGLIPFADWYKEADRVFALYIRWRDTGKPLPFDSGYGQCITCDKYLPYHQLENGHFIRRRHWGTRYDEKNCHAQCAHCNNQLGGNEIIYKEKVIAKYGQSACDILYYAKKFKSKKPTDYFFQIIIFKYQPYLPIDLKSHQKFFERIGNKC